MKRITVTGTEIYSFNPYKKTCLKHDKLGEQRHCISLLCVDHAILIYCWLSLNQHHETVLFISQLKEAIAIYSKLISKT